MRPILLIDFGSTYTKITAVDPDEPRILGTASALTTVATGLSHGLENALRDLTARTGSLSFAKRLACSSAAGGLKMVAVGLVPELTVEAAKRAALGAGARLSAAFGYKLGPAEVARIETLAPDIILLAGGTDGGNEEVILANAGLLAAAPIEAPVIVAGNKSVAAEAAAKLRAAGREVAVTANVLPELGRVEIGPAREEIRRLFLSRIIRAKGLAEVEGMLDGILMPTPAAVLRAAELLARGSGNQPGWGELILVDVGGATTDVHSMASGSPSRPEIIRKGLPEEFAKRTVEGDLGMRYSAAALAEACGMEQVAAAAGLDPAFVAAGIGRRTADPGYLAAGAEDERLETALGFLAVRTAIRRHAGVLETHYTPFGASYVLRGKDLTPVKKVIGTGGVLIRSKDSARLLAGAAFDRMEPENMLPEAPEYFLDREYIIPAMGLLAGEEAGAALALLEAGLVRV